MGRRRHHLADKQDPSSSQERPAGGAKDIGRREFVRAAGGLVAATWLEAGCKGTPEPLGFGTVRVAIVGLEPGFSSAGSARIEIPGLDPIVIDLPAASGEAEVPVGAYPVRYTPPMGYALAPGQSNETVVTITADQITDVQFTVVSASATLRIVVTGVQPSAAAAGTALLTRTDIADQVPFTVEIPTAGTIDTSLLPGTYDVSYSAPAGYQLVTSGQATLDVPADVVTTVSFQVQQGIQQPPAVVFHSDWSTALGTSDDAKLDRGQDLPWERFIGNGRLSEVVPSTGLDFPSPNVLLVIAGWRGSPPGAAAENPRIDGLPIPDVGESLFFRWYKRVVVPDAWAGDENTHPIQDANTGAETNWMQEVTVSPDGTWSHSWQVGANAWPNNRWYAPRLNKNQTYRFELQIHRLGTNTFQMHSRIYDSAGRLLYDDEDFTNVNGTGTLAEQPTLEFRDISILAGLQVGFNGLSSGVQSDFPMPLYYQGCVAIRTDDWCGPYSGGV